MLGSKRVERAIRRVPRVGRPSTHEVARARQTSRMVTIAAARLPVASKCLSRSLVLQVLLEVQGIESDLLLGVRRGEADLEFHAWIEHRGRPLNDVDDIGDRFETLHVVSSAPPAAPPTA